MLYKNAPSGAFFVYNTLIITKAIFIFYNGTTKPGKNRKIHHINIFTICINPFILTHCI